MFKIQQKYVAVYDHFRYDTCLKNAQQIFNAPGSQFHCNMGHKLYTVTEVYIVTK
jgi:hypothetical protein